MKRPGRWIVCIAACIAPFIPASASAHEAVDQRQATESSCWSIFNSGPLTQSFTAGVSGGLTEFTARVLATRGGTYTVSLSLYAADISGAPTGTALAQTDTTYNVGATPGAQVRTTLQFAFDEPIDITAGTRYAVEVSETGYRTSWCGGTGNPYAAGTANVGTNFDFAFATFVDVHGSGSEPDDLSGVGYDPRMLLAASAIAIGLGLALDRSSRRRTIVR